MPVTMAALCAAGATNAVAGHLVAQGAPIEEVIAQLARAKGFRVEANERISTPVTIDTVQSTQRLLTTILQDQNSIVAEEADPDCPGRSRVTMVWIVAKASVPTTVPGAAPKPKRYVTPEAKEQDGGVVTPAKGHVPAANFNERKPLSWHVVANVAVAASSLTCALQ